MNLAIVGSRGFKDYGLFQDVLAMLVRDYGRIDTIISGGAVGADSMAERYAIEKDIAKEIFEPDWDKHGKAAGFIRNKDIVDACDTLIAFWDGQSKGTKHSIDLAVKAGKEVFIVNY